MAADIAGYGPSMRAESTPSTTRRGFLAGAAAVGGLSLAGCGGSTTQNHPDSNSARGGVATKPLPPAKITVDAGQIRLLE